MCAVWGIEGLATAWGHMRDRKDRESWLERLRLLNVNLGSYWTTLLITLFFAAAMHAVPVCFSEDGGTLRDLLHIEEDVVVGKQVTLICVRRAAWGMLSADEGVVWTLVEGLAETITAALTVF